MRFCTDRGLFLSEAGAIPWRQAIRRALCFKGDVRIPDRFNSIARDPVRRLIEVHQHSLKLAARDRICDRARPPACREADAGQCRIVVNALRREIDRLQRGCEIEVIGFQQYCPTYCSDPCTRSAQLSAPPLHRKSYAMPADPPLRRDEPALPNTRQAHIYLQVTNLGTLMDVLG